MIKIYRFATYFMRAFNRIYPIIEVAERLLASVTAHVIRLLAL